MKAKLAGIASHTGMAGVFKLLGSDVYRVHAIQQVGSAVEAPQPVRSVLAALRKSGEQLRQCNDLDMLLNNTLQLLEREFAIRHAMIFLLDNNSQRLYAVASHGYENSGVGSEIACGDGVIGIAAQMRAPIRIGHMTSEYGYGRAVRDATAEAGFEQTLSMEIPLPGLPESRSQMAVPMVAFSQLIGVLYVESPQDSRFSYDDEDALFALAMQLGLSITQLTASATQSQNNADSEPLDAPAPVAAPNGKPAEIRYYAENNSVFIDGDYLIKGVAGAIFWALARDYIEQGKRTFSNRQLRLDPRIHLPELSDNLEARLILLAKRLAEREACIRIEKCGRGQFHLCVKRPLLLVAASAS
jgi:adenylate cyclase